jgi:hypothetical protein
MAPAGGSQERAPPAMKRPALRKNQFAPTWTMHSLRLRAEVPVVAALSRPGLPSAADHDFLVPNPRPDLTLDLQTLRMIQVG